MNVFCHRCGNNLPADSQFCNRCGTRLPTVSSPRRIMPPPVPYRRTAQPVDDRYEEEEEEYYYDEGDEYVDDGYEYEDEYVEEEEDEEGEPEPGEDVVIFQITQAFYRVGLQYFAAIVASMIITTLTALLAVPMWISLVCSLIFFIPPIYRHIIHNHTVYTLTTTKIEIEHGFLSKKSQSIPLRHVQDVTVSETLRERLLGIGDVLIDSAALDSKISLDDINNPRKYADLILEQAQRWN